MEAALGVIVAILAVVLPLVLAGWLLGRSGGDERPSQAPAPRAKMPR